MGASAVVASVVAAVVGMEPRSHRWDPYPASAAGSPAPERRSAPQAQEALPYPQDSVPAHPWRAVFFCFRLAALGLGAARSGRSLVGVRKGVDLLGQDVVGLVGVVGAVIPFPGGLVADGRIWR